MPALGVVGEIAAGPYAEMALKALASDVRGAVIAKAGLWIAEEQPDALAESLISFLARRRIAPEPAEVKQHAHELTTETGDTDHALDRSNTRV
jgi:hypothetical protein